MLCHLVFLSLLCSVLTATTPLEEEDAHGRGCWAQSTQEVIAYDTRVYRLGKQYICTQSGMETTGVELDDANHCWDWMLEEQVPADATLYHRCKQYKCTGGDWELVDGEEDPRCAGPRKGCKIHHSDEIAPFGTKGYFKCEQFECTEDGFQPTGVSNDKCTDGKGACWDWYKNEAILVGAKFFHNCIEYECIDSAYTDVIPTDVEDSRCVY